jgi:dihydroorotate dehydrogenase electron transfer subunit
MVKPSGSLDPFLPRAYSILRVRRLLPSRRRKSGNALEILYRVMGKGSTTLSRMKQGDRVDLLGPLGHGYQVPPDLTTALLVAGGIGVPPVVALAEMLARSQFMGRRSRNGKVGRRKMIAFIGGKTSDDILCLSDFRKSGAKVHVATEDGSVGHRGLVVDLLEAHLKTQTSRQGSIIYACGPHAMLHTVAEIAERFPVPCQVSLEADMACGFGACMGCVIPVKQSAVETWDTDGKRRAYKLCCKDGPAFDAREIAW